MPSVVSVGSVNVDRVARVDAATLARLREAPWFPAPGETRRVASLPDVDALVTDTLLGGKGANQAVAAARAGAESALLGAVGADEARFGVLDGLRRQGVDVTEVARLDGPTGTALVVVAPDGENHIALLAGANGRVDPAYVHAHLDRVRAAEVLLVQGELPTETLDALFLALDGQHGRPTVVFDPAPVEGVADLLVHACIDYLTPNEGEYAALAATGALERFRGTVVRTQGPDPVVVTGPSGGFRWQPPPVAAVDTTGAGDVFAGSLGASLAEGNDLHEAVERAGWAAALSTRTVGVQQATPDRTTVEQFRAEQEGNASGRDA